jgi:nitrogen-specific signal transduction histidine kinase
VIDNTREPLAVLTSELKIERANDAFYRLFATTKERAEDRPFFEFISHPETRGDIKAFLESSLTSSTGLTNREFTLDLAEPGKARVKATVRRVASGGQSYPLILVSITH